MGSSSNINASLTNASQAQGYTHELEAGLGFSGASQSTTTSYALATQVTVIYPRSAVFSGASFAAAAPRATASSSSVAVDDTEYDAEDLEPSEAGELLSPAEEELRATPSQDLDPSNFEHIEELNRRFEEQYGDDAWHSDLTRARYRDNTSEELLNASPPQKAIKKAESTATPKSTSSSDGAPEPTPIPPPALPASNGTSRSKSTVSPEVQKLIKQGPPPGEKDMDCRNEASDESQRNHRIDDGANRPSLLAHSESSEPHVREADGSRLSDSARGHGLVALASGAALFHGGGLGEVAQRGETASLKSLTPATSSAQAQALRLSAQILGTSSERASREGSSQAHGDASVEAAYVAAQAEQIEAQVAAQREAVDLNQHAARDSQAAHHVAFGATGLAELDPSSAANAGGVSPALSPESSLAAEPVDLLSRSSRETLDRERDERAARQHAFMLNDLSPLLQDNNDAALVSSLLGPNSSPDATPFESSLFLGNDHSGSTESAFRVASYADTAAPLGVFDLANLLTPQAVAQDASRSPVLQATLSILGAAYSHQTPTSSVARAARNTASILAPIVTASSKIEAPRRGGNMSDGSSGGSQHSEDDTRSESVDAFNAFSA